MRSTIYLPDALGQQVRDAGLSVSAICRAALTEELKRMQTIEDTRGAMEEILVDLASNDNWYEGRFRGTWLVGPDDDNTYGGPFYWGVALTEKGNLAVYRRHSKDNIDPSITTYETLEKARKDIPPVLYAEVATAMGKPAVIDLDL